MPTSWQNALVLEDREELVHSPLVERGVAALDIEPLSNKKIRTMYPNASHVLSEIVEVEPK